MRNFRMRMAGLFLALGGAVGVGGVTSPAQAQFSFFGPPVLPERAIVDLLRHDGFRRISPPVLNRNVYFIDAVDPYGEPVRVVVGAYDGRILEAQERRMSSWRPVNPEDDIVDDFAPRLVPPRGIPTVPRAPMKQALAPVAPQTPPPAAKPQIAPVQPPRPVAVPHAPKAPASAIRKAPVPAPTLSDTVARPAEQGAPPKAPTAAVAPAAGSKTTPRVIDMTPPALLDDAQKKTAAPPPMFPPATLD